MSQHCQYQFHTNNLGDSANYLKLFFFMYTLMKHIFVIENTLDNCIIHHCIYISLFIKATINNKNYNMKLHKNDNKILYKYRTVYR